MRSDARRGVASEIEGKRGLRRTTARSQGFDGAGIKKDTTYRNGIELSAVELVGYPTQLSIDGAHLLGEKGRGPQRACRSGQSTHAVKCLSRVTAA